MQSLYTLGVRQTTAIQADLERLRSGDHSVSLLGASCTIPKQGGTYQLTRLQTLLCLFVIQAKYRHRSPPSTEL